MSATLSSSNLQEQDEFFAQKSRFISHEIKNQLSVINLYTELIEKINDGNESVESSTKTIFNAVSSITNLLQELKSVSEICMEECDLNTVVEETVSGIKEMANQNNITLINDIDSVCKIVIDKQKFQNVLLNLVKNAVEALKETERKDKYIRLSAVTVGKKVLLRVENNGNRIEKKYWSTIFEEGFTTKKTGSGLGLNICRRTLQQQSCDLSLLKSDNRQTVFEIVMNKI